MSSIDRRNFLKQSLTGGMGIFTAPFLRGSGPESKPSVNFRRPPDDASTQMVGYAERDITPEVGMEKPGGYGKVFHQSIHDPCKVRAAVFGDGPGRVAIVGIDSLMIPRKTVLSVRNVIHERCGIDSKAVMIGASHSHSSGPVGMVQAGQYDHASKLVQELAYEKSSAANPAYLREVNRALVEGVCEADKNREKSHCGVGAEVADQVAFNRRFHMKNGLTYTHPQQGNPSIAKVAGPTDSEVGVIGTWNNKGKLTGCVVNFACHATTNPGGISANYIYYLEKTIRGVFGPEVKVVFVNGASGDVTQVDNLTPYQQYSSGEEAARTVGGSIGAEAVKALISMDRGQLMPTGAQNKVWDIPRRVPRPQRVKESYDIVKEGPEKAGSTKWAFAKEILMLDAMLEKSPAAEVEVQAIQVGPVVFLSVPAEYFCAYGLEMKARSQFPHTFPVSMANGCVGYVPTEEAFGEHGGGYETRLTSYSNLEPTAGRQMLESLLELSTKMDPGKRPKRPAASEFSGPWSYGAVPPELGMWKMH